MGAYYTKSKYCLQCAVASKVVKGPAVDARARATGRMGRSWGSAAWHLLCTGAEGVASTAISWFRLVGRGAGSGRRRPVQWPHSR